MVGIIDAVQLWTLGKRAERCAKTALLRRDPHGISAVPVAQYQRRFMRFMREVFQAREDARHEARGR